MAQQQMMMMGAPAPPPEPTEQEMAMQNLMETFTLGVQWFETTIRWSAFPLIVYMATRPANHNITISTFFPSMM